LAEYSPSDAGCAVRDRFARLLFEVDTGAMGRFY